MRSKETMKYTIIQDNGTFRVHKVNCQDAQRDIKRGKNHWDNEAANVEGLIHLEKQELYESAGGHGDFELDTDIENEPRSFAEQYFEILPCARI